MNEMMDLIKKEFWKEFVKGTGKAIILLKDHPEIDFSEMIMEGCLQNLDYDPQCSGDRAEYLFEMMSMLKDRDSFEKKLLEEFLKPDLDYWGTDQMFELLRLMAQNGNHRAKEAIYQKYSQLWEGEEDVSGTETIVSLDGLEGLAYVAERTGQYLKWYPEETANDWPIEYAARLKTEINPKEYLREKAKDNEFIRLYLQAVERDSQDRKERKDSNHPTYEDVKARIDSNQRFHGMFGSRMNDEDFERLARDFQQENSEERLIKYLRIFSYRKYPYKYQDILKHVYSTNKDIRAGAVWSLQFFKNEDVRKLMATHFKNREHLGETFRLLKKNYHSSDIKDIEFLLSNEDDLDEFHFMAMKLDDVVEVYNDPALTGALLIAYNRGHCAMCREGFVRGLTQLKSLPDWIAEEGVHDCNTEVRNIIKNYKK